MIEVIPSILSPTLEDAQRKLDLCRGQVQSVHLDIADNTFVKNKTFALEEFSRLRTDLVIRPHLMVSNPLGVASHLIGKVPSVFFHYEAVKNFRETLEALNQHFHVGVVLNIETPARVLFAHLDKIEFVLIMTVTTGFGGGKFNAEPLKKILHLKTLKPDLVIGVDGGVNIKTTEIIKQYPVDFATPGMALFGAPDFAKALEELRAALS